jgi:hypothetical protein
MDANTTLDLDYISGGVHSTPLLYVDVSGIGKIMAEANSQGRCDLNVYRSTLTPGSGLPGKLFITANPNFSAYGGKFPRLVLSIAGAGGVAGTDYGQLVVSGSASGLDQLDLVANIAPGRNFTGAVLTVMTTTNVLSGTLHSASFNGIGIADVALGGTNVGGTRGWITLSRITYNGDITRDGKVDADDYKVWFGNFGQTYTPGLNGSNWQNGDMTGDGKVDADDYELWFANFGADQAANPVPEPATLSAFLLGGLFALRHRRRWGH